jgi:DNA-binding response OmpR family regulator
LDAGSVSRTAPWILPPDATGTATKTLDVHMASLRKKLGDPGLIETVRGVGFRLRSDE